MIQAENSLSATFKNCVSKKNSRICYDKRLTCSWAFLGFFGNPFTDPESIERKIWKLKIQ